MPAHAAEVPSFVWVTQIPERNSLGLPKRIATPYGTTTKLESEAEIAAAYLPDLPDDVATAVASKSEESLFRRVLEMGNLRLKGCKHTASTLNPSRSTTRWLQFALMLLLGIAYATIFWAYVAYKDFSVFNHFTWWMWGYLWLNAVLMNVSVMIPVTMQYFLDYFYTFANGVMGSVAILVTFVSYWGTDNFIDPSTGQISGAYLVGNIVIHYVPIAIQIGFAYHYGNTINHHRRCHSGWTSIGVKRGRTVFMIFYLFLVPSLPYLIYVCNFNVIEEYKLETSPLPAWVADWYVQWPLFMVTCLISNSGAVFDYVKTQEETDKYITLMVGDSEDPAFRDLINRRRKRENSTCQRRCRPAQEIRLNQTQQVEFGLTRQRLLQRIDSVRKDFLTQLPDRLGTVA